MSKYDDDYDVYGGEEDIDEDEDGSSGRPSASPFNRPASSLPGGSRVSGAGLPSRPAVPSSGSVPSPIRSPGANPNAPSGSGGSSSFGGGQPQRPSAPGGSGSGSGSSPAPFQKPGGSLLSPRPGDKPSAPGGGRDDTRKDDGGKSPLGGLGKGLGGVTSRFGGGGDDKKNDTRKDSDSKGGLGGLGKGLGGVTSRFGGGDDKKPASKPGDSGGPLGGFMSKLGGGDKKPDSKPPSGGSSGGPLGGLFGKGDKKPDTPSRPGGMPSSSGTSSSASSSSSFGSRPSSGTPSRPGTPAPPAKGASGKSAKQSGPGIMDRIKGFNPFAPKQDSKTAKSAAAARSGKPVEVRTLSVSLDKKLELLGIALVLSSIVLLLTSLSPSPGAVTQQINELLSKLFGWGAVAIPIAMFPLGIWLIMLRAGHHDTPVVDLTRVFGAVLLYLAVLTAFQFIDSFNYPGNEYSSYQQYLSALRNVLLPLSTEFGRGGGRVGSELYYLLISNFGEMAGFVILVGWLVVAAMFALSLSAQDIIAIFISNYRNLSDARQQRALRQTAARAEREAALAAQISVTKPATQLADGKSPALPAAASGAPALTAAAESVEPEKRNIPITMGGRTVTASFRPGEPALIDEEADEMAAPIPLRLPAQPEPVRAASAAEQKPTERGGLLGGIGSRLRSTAPVIGAAAAGAKLAADAVKGEAASKPGQPDDSKNDGKEKGRLGSGLFRRSDSKPADDAPVTPAASLIAPAAPAGAAAEQKPGEAAPNKSRFGGLGQVGGRLFSGQGKPEDSAAKPAAAAASKSDESAFKPPAAQPNAGGSPVTNQASKPAATVSPAAPAADTQAAKPENQTAPAQPAAAGGEEAPPARLGDLLRPQTPAAGSPASSLKPSRPSPFQRPPLAAPQSAKADAPGEAGEKDDSSPAEKLSRAPASHPAAPMRPVASAALPRRPLDDDPDIEDEDEEEREDWSKLPPAKPKAASAPEPAGDTAAPIPDLQTRLSALRSGQPLGAASARTDDQPAEEAKENNSPQRPAAFSRVETGTAEAADAPKPARPSTPLTPSKPAAPSADAAKPVQPTAPRSASPAFGRPEAPTTGTTRLSPPPAAPSQPNTPAENAPQRPAASVGQASGSGVSAPRPYNATPVTVEHGSAPPAPPPPARSATTLGSAAAAPRPEAGSSQPPPPPTLKQPRKQWNLPDLNTLLASGSDQELNHDFLIERARTIEDTLSSFGAPGRVVEVRTGPVITQFGVEPDYVAARGKKNRVKVSAIAALDKDLQLALGAKSIRIEAPVPGKGYVGIEVPNEHPSVVRLRDVMESNEYKRIHSPLAIALGQGVDGTPVAADLGSMPHLLIAGTTGSGKSVCVNTIIASLLIQNTPDRLKFIMVDPKRVELTSYNGVPHLVAPVVVELERIVSVLKWVTREMDERYRKFSNAGARNIEDFNKHLPSGEPLMPYIVVIIDELADLMMLAPDETERVITRIAALARATGIHLVIATQRPSVDVVTGLIKANFPARIAFAVAGSVDSRVILDQPGAERLLGRGDMLYMSGDSPAPVRLQGVYVSDEEINNITRYWRGQMSDPDLASQGRPILSQFMLDEQVKRESSSSGGKNWTQEQNNNRGGQAYWDREVTGQSAPYLHAQSDNGDDGDGEDVMYEQAVELIRRLNKASVSLLQRRLRIGYTRAARLIDLMEERGIVGPATEGSKPREVLPLKD